ncbi:hypothetical protein NM688_g6702 [Phlebia brevispora]|uniref:Uncharacterized protein n=1 Tax=Phlebia brevispora TaxID=194682 RepID=A0ACC1SDH1_9APHY|nr:hypothetical protein NM688_g6702 [Phlebia brevispora]
MDCPILVWMLSYNRSLTQEEYDQCYQTLRQCVPHAQVPYATPQNQEFVRQMIAYILPLLMMRHRRISRLKWRDNCTPNGKRWIEQLPDHPMDTRVRAMIGYHLAYEANLVGMVMTQGRQREVVNIGLGIKQLCHPPDTPVPVYVESLYHKLTRLEISFCSPPQPDDVILRRVCLLLALKQAYIKAIGQPIGFDWSRLEFSPEENVAKGDGIVLKGWEFRIWQAHIQIMHDDESIEEHLYQCACAFYRGNDSVKFIWQKDRKDLDSWVQFLTVDQLMSVLPKLTD